MDKQDLNQILIKDTEYYNRSAKYNLVLRRHNINTVAQLLDDDFMKYAVKCNHDTRNQIICLKSMLKHKYLNEPLFNDVLLDYKIDVKNLRYSKIIKYIDKKGEDHKLNLVQLFGCSQNMANDITTAFQKSFYSPASYINYSRIPDTVPFIDFLRWLKTIKKFESIQLVVNTYIDEYNKKQKPVKNTADEIKDLKIELASLIKERDALNIEILKLYNHINRLTYNKQKGGAQR